MPEQQRSRVRPCWVIKVGSALLTSNATEPDNVRSALLTSNATEPDNVRSALLTSNATELDNVRSALLTSNATELDIERLADWAGQIHRIGKDGINIVIVSSGAIAAGMKKLGWRHRPHALNEQQAAAAVGQTGLAEAWATAFEPFQITTAQVLLTEADLGHRTRYLNARTTLRTLLDLGVIPIVNENDTVAIDEIRFGDNDTLAALVTNLVEAQKLVILTDQAGLYDADPRVESAAVLIPEAVAGDPLLTEVAGDSGELGRGGMRTKVRAADLAARSGALTMIASGQLDGVLDKIHAGENPGTRLVATQGRLASRKQWLAGLRPRGRLILDEGAVRVLKESGRSLLPVGIQKVECEFDRGDVVSCIDPAGVEIARGLVNYNASDAARIAGYPSDAIEERLSYVDEPELIHRDNLVLTG